MSSSSSSSNSPAPIRSRKIKREQASDKELDNIYRRPTAHTLVSRTQNMRYYLAYVPACNKDSYCISVFQECKSWEDARSYLSSFLEKPLPQCVAKIFKKKSSKKLEADQGAGVQKKKRVVETDSEAIEVGLEEEDCLNNDKWNFECYDPKMPSEFYEETFLSQQVCCLSRRHLFYIIETKGSVKRGEVRQMLFIP